VRGCWLVAVSMEAMTEGISPNMSSKYFVAVETQYTILVSKVTALVTLYPPLANQLQQPMTQLRSDKDLKQAIERGRIPEATAAAKRR
jgi:hypothetical protein